MYQQDNRDAYFERKEEEKEARRDRWRLTMGLMEFLAVVAGVAVTLVLVLPWLIKLCRLLLPKETV